MVEEQSFIATIHQKTDPALLQFCLLSCFLSQVKPKKDPAYPAKVYKVEKAMYGLHQAPRAWYATAKACAVFKLKCEDVPNTLYLKDNRPAMAASLKGCPAMIWPFKFIIAIDNGYHHNSHEIESDRKCTNHNSYHHDSYRIPFTQNVSYVGNKMHKAFPLPVMEFLLPKEVPTSSEESTHCQKKSNATAVKIALLLKSRRNCQSNSDDSFTKDSYEVPASAASAATTDTAKTLEQTFNRLQVIIGQLQFMDVEIEQDDLNQKFLTSLAPKWLMHTIVWRNMSDLDTMSLDDLGNEEVNTASVSTASTNVPTASANIGVASISQDTACTYIASQSSGKKITIQGSDVAGFDKSKSYMANDEENHALVADKEAPTEFALMDNTSAERLAQVESRLAEHRDREIKYCEKIRALKDLDSLFESQRLDKNKEGLGYSVVPPPAQIYSPPKKDMSWTGLPEFKDDNVTDYSRPAPTVESSQDDAQNRNPSVTETKASTSTISPKYFIKFVKANDSPTNSKTDKAKTAKKSPIKYDEQYKKPTKKPNVRGNQRNWNNLKYHQLGPNFVMNKNACFNCGDFNHLAYDCSKRVKKGTSRSQNTTHKSFTPRPAVHYRIPMRPMRSNMNVAALGT
nr:reverse transcriptase [Tanacetum cinerariifolium]